MKDPKKLPAALFDFLSSMEIDFPSTKNEEGDDLRGVEGKGERRDRALFSRFRFNKSVDAMNSFTRL